jgi:TRAP-type mannitol/chloroaromatic compound transport system substrate-binding protein
MTSAHTAWFGDDDKPKTTTAQDHKTYTLKLAETWPSNFPIFGDAKGIEVKNKVLMSLPFQ